MLLSEKVSAMFKGLGGGHNNAGRVVTILCNKKVLSFDLFDRFLAVELFSRWILYKSNEKMISMNSSSSYTN